MTDDKNRQDRKVDFEAVRDRMANLQGPRFWQGLDELAETDEFKEYLEREFPRGAALLAGGMTRRNFLKVMAASMALAGLAGCVNMPQGRLVPYVKSPDAEMVPGQSLFYSTAMAQGGYGMGLLVRSYLGRPVKVEGNPDHPASLGATDTFAQAAILQLYDPDRGQAVTSGGDIRTYTDFVAQFSAIINGAKGNQGSGLRILTEPISSPTLAAQIKAIQDAFPQARWHQWDPAGADNALAGSQMAFGRAVHTVYHFAAANVILSLDCDFLQAHAPTLRYARDFAGRRNDRAAGKGMNRLYAVEASPALTGAKADHKLRMQAREVQGFAQDVAQRLGVASLGAGTPPAGVPAQWVDALVRDLQANKGSSIVIAGDGQPPVVHALAHAMNAALGNAGKTVTYTDPVIDQPTDLHNSLRELVQDMDAGQVTTLLIIGANPAYTAPADIPFASAYQKVAQRIYVGMYHDETAALSQWYIPEAHFLEAWGDVRAHDGTVAIVQPLIEPLFNGRSAAEILALFTSPTPSSSYDIVRAYWQGQHGGGDFDAWWQGALNRGIVPDTSVPATNPTVDTGRIDSALATQGGSGGLEIIFQPDPSVWDGRFANNGWLQELPKPLTKVTWDNPILISPATAQRLGLQNEDEVELRYNGRTATAPVYVLPGHADESVTVHLGYGRGQEAGRVAAGVGFNAYRLRTSTRPWFDQGLEIVKTGGKHPLATTQYHWKMEGRDLVHVGTQQQYQQNPNFLQKAPEPISLYPKWQYTGNSWGMAIDMTACIGCNACVIACQAENNIPVVGKEMVLRQREMHWLRVDRYYEGSLDDPQTVFQPVPCMHCENAPCEAVCPVGAMVHSQDGLNDMVYNRCVGTRYCSNNCPYKVRRFNFFSYTDNLASEPTLKMMQNPDVTVRNRGVMEKCTYCVQRIREADSRASAEGRPVQDGEVMTACQAVCPANAISFGNMNDQNAEVNKWKALPLNYALLAELNTQPHTTYLAALRNPNPEIEALAPRAEAAPRSGAE